MFFAKGWLAKVAPLCFSPTEMAEIAEIKN